MWQSPISGRYLIMWTPQSGSLLLMILSCGLQNMEFNHTNRLIHSVFLWFYTQHTQAHLCLRFWFFQMFLTWCSVSVICQDLWHWVRPQSWPRERSPSWPLSGGQGRRQGPRWCPGPSHGSWLWSWDRSPRKKPADPRSVLWWEACGKLRPHGLKAEWGGNNWEGKVFYCQVQCGNVEGRYSTLTTESIPSLLSGLVWISKLSVGSPLMIK